jgi:hypothetical protein
MLPLATFVRAIPIVVPLTEVTETRYNVGDKLHQIQTFRTVWPLVSGMSAFSSKSSEMFCRVQGFVWHE